MFGTVIIDFTPLRLHSSAPLETRLYPFLYLVADQVLEAGFKRSSRLPFVNLVNAIDEGRPHLLDMAKNGEGILFTADTDLKASLLQGQGLTAQNAILLLAAAGLEISVPNLSLDIARSEEIATVREKLEEERTRYVIRVTELADQAFERLSNGQYKETAAWAIDQAAFKIAPVARQYELAIRKLDRSLLDRIGLNFFKEGLPAIGSTLSEKGVAAARGKAIRVVLEVMCNNLALTIEERKRPEGVYGVKLAHSLSKPLSTPSLESDG
jgi:hypothetical protein